MLGKRWTYTSFSRVYVLKKERERVRKYKEKKNKIINMINDIIKMKKKQENHAKINPWPFGFIYKLFALIFCKWLVPCTQQYHYLLTTHPLLKQMLNKKVNIQSYKCLTVPCMHNIQP